MKIFRKLMLQLKRPIAFLLTLAMVMGAFPFSSTAMPGVATSLGTMLSVEASESNEDGNGTSGLPPYLGLGWAYSFVQEAQRLPSVQPLQAWEISGKDNRPPVEPAPPGWTPITNADQLRQILQASDTATRRGNYWLMTDLDLGGFSLHNGTTVRVFEGTFEGNNRIITGLSEANNMRYQGFFRRTLNAKIRNLNVVVHINGLRGQRDTGGLVGFAEGTTELVNCHFVISIGGFVGGIRTSSLGWNTQSGDRYYDVGGLVGRMTNGTIRDSSVVLYGESYIKGSYNIGGLVGRANNASVSNSVVIHEGISGFSGIRGTYHVGGLIGLAERVRIFRGFTYGHHWDTESYRNLSNPNLNRNQPEAANVFGVWGERTMSSGSRTGGLVGRAASTSTIDQCASYLNVRGVNLTGGLVGSLVSGSMVRNSYARGLVTGARRVGGLVGYAEAGATTIHNTYASGPVIGSRDVGAWVGQRATAVRNILGMSYYDINISQMRGTGLPHNNIPQGRSTMDMMLESTFVAAPGMWDFGAVWGIGLYADQELYPGFDQEATYPYILGMPGRQKGKGEPGEITAQPWVDEIVAGATKITGMGHQEGSIITVYWPAREGMEISPTVTTVGADMTWSVDVPAYPAHPDIPQGYTYVLRQFEMVRVTQQQMQPEMLGVSAPFLQIVIHNDPVHPAVDKSFDNLTEEDENRPGGKNLPGDMIRYVITVENDGRDLASTLRDVVITDVIPQGVTYIEGSVRRWLEPPEDSEEEGAWVLFTGAGSSAAYTSSNRTLTINLGTAIGNRPTPGSDVILSFQVKIDDVAPENLPRTIINTVNVAGRMFLGTGIAWPNLTTNSFTRSADVDLVVSGDSKVTFIHHDGHMKEVFPDLDDCEDDADEIMVPVFGYINPLPDFRPCHKYNNMPGNLPYFEFKGWYTNTFGRGVEFKANTMVIDDLDLYPYLVPIGHVIFDGGGALDNEGEATQHWSGQMSYSYRYDGTIVVFPLQLYVGDNSRGFEKEDHTFRGWALYHYEDDGTGNLVKVVDTTPIPSGNILIGSPKIEYRLMALWDKIDLRIPVTIDENYFDGDTYLERVEPGDILPRPTPDPERTDNRYDGLFYERQHHDFGEWFKDRALTEEYDFATPVTDEFSIYARWDPRYSIRYFANGATTGTPPEDGNLYKQHKGTIGSNLVDSGLALVASQNDMNRPNFFFTGWMANSPLYGSFVAASSATDASTLIINHNYDLYARWLPIPIMPRSPAPFAQPMAWSEASSVNFSPMAGMAINYTAMAPIRAANASEELYRTVTGDASYIYTLHAFVYGVGQYKVEANVPSSTGLPKWSDTTIRSRPWDVPGQEDLPRPGHPLYNIHPWYMFEGPWSFTISDNVDLNVGDMIHIRFFDRGSNMFENRAQFMLEINSNKVSFVDSEFGTEFEDQEHKGWIQIGAGNGDWQNNPPANPSKGQVRAVDPQMPPQPNHQFLGWFTHPTDGNIPWDFDNDNVDGDMTLWARWSADPWVPVVPGDLRVTKTSNAPGGTTNVGATITYTVTVTNDREWSLLKDVELIDILPEHAGFVPLSVKIGGDSVSSHVDNGTLKVNLGDIAGKTSKVVTYDVKVADNAHGETLVNNVKAEGTCSTDPAMKISANATLSIEVTPKTTKPEVNDITEGDSDVSGTGVPGAEITVTWPGSTPDSKVTVEDDGTWTVPVPPGVELEAGDEVKVVQEDKDSGKPPSDEVKVIVEERPTIVIPGQPTIVQVIKQSSNGTAKVEVGDTITYLIEVKNNGEEKSLWYNVTLEDIIPDEVTLDESSIVTSTGVTHTYTNGVLSVSLGNIGGGVTKSISYQVTVKNDAYGKFIDNTAEASGKNANAQGTVVTRQATNRVEVEGRPSMGPDDPSVTKTSNAPGGKVGIGQTVTYTVIARNDGPTGSIWKDAVMTDTLSQYVDFNQSSVMIGNASPPAGSVSFNALTRVLTVQLGDIASNSEVRVTYTVEVKADTPYETAIANEVTISGEDAGSGDPVEKEDDVTVVVDSRPSPTLEDLEVIKTSNAVNPVKVGNEITYTVTVKNNGAPETLWSDVVLTDTLPIGLTFVNDSVEIGGAEVPHTFVNRILTVDLGDIDGGTTITVTYKVTVDPNTYGQTLTNQVTVEGGGLEKDDNEPIVVPPLPAEHQVFIDKTADKKAVKPGEIITYTVEVRNDGPPASVWPNVVITDELPKLHTEFIAGSVYINDIQAANDVYEYKQEPLHELIIELGDIPGGSSINVTYKVRVKEGATGTLANKISAEGWPIVTPPIIEPVEVRPPMGDDAANVEKKSDAVNGKAVVGQIVKYTVTISNNGPEHSLWEEAVMTDELSEHVMLLTSSVRVDNQLPTSMSLIDNVLTVNVGDIEGGTNKVVTYEVIIKADAYGKTVTNDVTVSGTDAGGEEDDPPVTGEDSEEIVIVRPLPEDHQTEVFKTSSAANPVKVGSTITYTVIAANNGIAASAWPDAEMIDVLPEGLTFVEGSVFINNKSAEAHEYEYDETTHTLKVILGDILGKTSKIVKYDVTVDDGTYGQTLTNNVTVSGGGLENGDNEPIVVPPLPDPANHEAKLTKTADKTAVKPGEIITYTVVASNEGLPESVWPDVVLIDELPTGTTFEIDSVYIGQVKVDYEYSLAPEHKLIIELGDIPGGSSITVTYQVKVKADATGTLENKISAEGGPIVTPPVIEPVEVRPPMGDDAAVVEKRSNAVDGKAEVGQLITYTVTASNNGEVNSLWEDAVMIDELSEFVTLIMSSVRVDNQLPTSMSLIDNVLTVSLGDIGAGASKVVTYDVVIKADAHGKTVTNDVTVAGKDAGGEEGDNDVEADDSENIKIASPEPAEHQAKLTKTADKTSVKPGEIITYTVVASNEGLPESVWPDVVLIDELPTGTTFEIDSVYIGQVKVDYEYSLAPEHKLIIELGDIPGGSSITVTYKVRVKADATGTLENKISAEGGTIVTPPIIEPVIVRPPMGDDAAVVEKESNAVDGKAVVGQVITYKITASNNGPVDSLWKDVVITDVLSQYVSFNLDSVQIGDQPAGSRARYITATRTLIVNLGDIEGQTSKEVTYTVTILSNAHGETVTNNVNVYGKDAGGEDGDDDVEADDKEDVIVTRPALSPGDLHVEKTSDSGGTAEVGDRVFYTVVASNTGPAGSMWENAVMTDVLSEHVEINMTSVRINAKLATSDQASFDVPTRTLTVQLGNIASGDEVIVSYAVTIKESAYGETITNSVEVDGIGGKADDGEDIIIGQGLHVVTFRTNYAGDDFKSEVVRGGKVANPNYTRTDERLDGFYHQRNQHELNGWFTDPACTLPYNFDNPVNESFTLYAKWTQVYTIVYYKNDSVALPATGTAPVDESNPYYMSISALDMAYTKNQGDLDRPRFFYSGWMVNDGMYGSVATAGSAVRINGNIDLYARWIPIPTITPLSAPIPFAAASNYAAMAPAWADINGLSPMMGMAVSFTEAATIRAASADPPPYRTVNGEGASTFAMHAFLLREWKQTPVPTGDVIWQDMDVYIDPYIIPGQEDFPRPGDPLYHLVKWNETYGKWSFTIDDSVDVRNRDMIFIRYWDLVLGTYDDRGQILLEIYSNNVDFVDHSGVNNIPSQSIKGWIQTGFGTDWVDKPFANPAKSKMLAEEPQTTMRPNYDFLGWFTHPTDGSTPWNFETSIVEGNMTLYARWQMHDPVPMGLDDGVVEKTSDAVGNVDVGETITYTVTASNNGDQWSEWQNVVMTDVLPAKVTFVENSVKIGTTEADYALSADGRTLTVELGNIPGQTSKVVTYKVTVNNDAYGETLKNSVTVSGTDASDPGKTVVDNDDVEVVVNDQNKTNQPTVDTITEGDKEITGTGEPGAEITVTWPDDSVPDSTVTVDENGDWSVPVPPGVDLEAGDEVEVVQKADDKNPSDPVIKEVLPRPSVGDDNAIVEKTSKSGDTAEVGDTITYEVTVSNNGPEKSLWYGAVMTDILPAGVTLVEGSVEIDGTPVDYALSADGRTLTVELGNIPGQDVKVVTYEVTVDDDAYGMTLKNDVNVSGKDGNDGGEPVDGGDSNEVDVTDKDKTGQPIVNPITEGDEEVTGTGEPGAEITVTWPDDSVPDSTVTVDENGDWSVPVPPGVDLEEGDKVEVVQKADDKDPSDPEIVTVGPRPTDKTDEPIVNPITEGDTEVTGTGEPGAEITVTWPDDSVPDSTVTVDENGDWSVPVPPGVDLEAGDKVEVVQKADDKDQSDPVIKEVLPRPSIGPEDIEVAKTSNTNGKVDVGTTITYTVTARNKGDEKSLWYDAVMTDVLPEGVTFVDGSVEIGGTKVQYTLTGQTLTVELGNIPGNTSKVITYKVTVNADAYGKTLKNSVTVSDEDGNSDGDEDEIKVDDERKKSRNPDIYYMYAGETVVRGSGIAGAEVTVTFPEGETITVTVDDDGKWSVDVPYGELIKGQEISAIQQEPGLDPSNRVFETVRDPRDTSGGDKGKSNEPSVDPIDEGATEVTGTGDPGADIIVIWPDGSAPDSTVKVDDEGNWTVPVPPGVDLEEGDIVIVIQVEGEKDPSDEVPVTVGSGEGGGEPGGGISDQPTVNEVFPEDDEVKGTGNPGADITVTWPDGSESDTEVDDDGNWTVPIPDGVKLNPGDEIEVVQTEDGKQPSNPVIVEVGKAQSTNPELDEIYEGDEQITGTGVPGTNDKPTVILVKFPGGETRETIVDPDGNWAVAVPDGVSLRKGDRVVAVQTEFGKNPSNDVEEYVQGPRSQTSDRPTINYVGPESQEVTGTGKPGAEIIVTFPNNGGTVPTTVDGNGTWSVKVPDGLNLAIGDIIKAVQVESGKTASDPVNATVSGSHLTFRSNDSTYADLVVNKGRRFGDVRPQFNPVRAGYTFLGWQLEGESGLFSNDRTVDLDRMVFVAVWQRDSTGGNGGGGGGNDPRNHPRPNELVSWGSEEEPTIEFVSYEPPLAIFEPIPITQEFEPISEPEWEWVQIEETPTPQGEFGEKVNPQTGDWGSDHENKNRVVDFTALLGIALAALALIRRRKEVGN